MAGVRCISNGTIPSRRKKQKRHAGSRGLNVAATDFQTMLNDQGVKNDAFQISPFLAEWLAGGKPLNQLAISAVCNSRCLFCSNHLNPFPVLAGVFRDVEDIKTQLASMTPNDDPIRMSDSLPGRIAEGEALLHPRLFDILELVRRKFFYNTLCFTTNGSILDEAFLKRLSGFRPVEVTVSMHSTNPELWSKIFGNKKEHARKAISSLSLIRQYGMDLIGTIVPLPRICGWDDIEKTYAYFVAQGAKQMIVYQPGWTLRTPAGRRKDLECSPEEFLSFSSRMKERHPVPLSALPDLESPAKIPVEAIIAETLSGNPKNLGGPYKQVVWLSSRAAFPKIAALLVEKAAFAQNRHHVFPVDNLTYGGNIITAGLLMVDDMVKAGQAALEQFPDADLFLVPATPFDGLLRDLQGVPAYRIAEALGRPVCLVQENGAMDMLLSFRLTNRRKNPDSELSETMIRFNDACRGQEKIGSALEMIASYPVSVPAGRLDRRRLKNYLLGRGGRMTSVFLLAQHFELLNQDNAVCIEKWMRTDNRERFNRWTFLTRVKSQWLIRSVAEGNMP